MRRVRGLANHPLAHCQGRLKRIRASTLSSTSPSRRAEGTDNGESWLSVGDLIVFTNLAVHVDGVFVAVAVAARWLCASRDFGERADACLVYA